MSIRVLKQVFVRPLDDSQLEQHGAAAGNAILLLGDNFITEALGPRPSLDLDALSKPSQVMLRCFAYTDVLRCFAMGDRRTVFNLKGVPGESEHADDSTTIITDPVATSSTLCQAKGANASAVTHSPWGLPEGLMLSFAAIANLAKDIEELEPTPFEYDWRPRRNTIEAHIRAWRATTERAATGTGEDDSVKAMDSMITSEMWRHVRALTRGPKDRSSPVFVPHVAVLIYSALACSLARARATDGLDLPLPIYRRFRPFAPSDSSLVGAADAARFEGCHAGRVGTGTGVSRHVHSFQSTRSRHHRQRRCRRSAGPHRKRRARQRHRQREWLPPSVQRDL